MTAITATGGKLYTGHVAINSDITPAKNTVPLVIEDPVVSNNGVYAKVSDAGSGSWSRVGDVPGYQFVRADNVGAGAPNAIVATSALPISSDTLVYLPIVATNTASPVTVSFNGGSALTVKTNSGGDVVVGGLVAGMVLLGVVSGAMFRLVSDQASAAVVAAAEDAADRAEAAANSNATYLNVAQFVASEIHSSVTFVRTAGYNTPGDGGGAVYVRVSAPPSHVAKVQSADGVWWEAALISNPLQIGAKGDGAIDDTAKFTALGSVPGVDRIDLLGKTYLVTALPTSRLFVNGFFRGDFAVPSEGMQTIAAPESKAIITASVDTGGVGSAYAGGVESTPTVPGRTTPELYFLLASQGCRARGPSRAGAIASIYGEASGNLSLLLACRQSRALMPQTFMLGTEECQADTGSRGGAIGSYGSFAEGVGAVVLAGRKSRASGWESAVVGSNDCVAGNGTQPRFNIVVGTDGGISAVNIVSGGSGLPAAPTYEVTDRRGAGTGATFNITVTAGVVTAVAVTAPGANYSQIPGAVNLVLFHRSMAVVGSAASSAKGSQSMVGGSGNSEATNNQSAVIASNRGTASGINSAVIAAGPTSGGAGRQNCIASGDNSAVIAAGDSVASQPYAVAFGQINTASAISAISTGRRTENNVARSIALGDAGSGVALTANRKVHLLPNGAVQISGALTQNNVFTDIAKMFENVEPTAIPRGCLVTWDGRKVRLAEEGDEAFSAHSRTYSILLGDSSFTWSSRYLYDEFGEPLIGDVWDEEEGAYVKGHLENPDFDPEQENIPRSSRRDEWTPVCLFGEVHVRVDTTVGLNDWVKPTSIPGIGGRADSHTRLRCMAITTAYNAEAGYAIALCLRD